MNVRSGRGIQHVAMSGGCITHLSRARQSYVDVEQSCVTGLDSCHACHGMRGAGARRLENVAEASVLVISSLMNIIKIPFSEQEIVLTAKVAVQQSIMSVRLSVCLSVCLSVTKVEIHLLIFHKANQSTV